MRCLVTGGAGFIGSTLVDYLLRDGHFVDVVDDLSSGNTQNLEQAKTTGKMAFHEADIRDASIVGLVKGCEPEIIFHLAAQADVRVSVSNPTLDASVNIIGTLNVLEGARLAKTRRIIAAASGGTLYGEPADNEIPTKESAPHRPLSPYGVSKKSMIDYLSTYSVLHGIDYVALALANVYGPRQNAHGEAGVVAIFTQRLLDEQNVTIYGNGGQTRDFVYVDDVVRAFVLAATKGGGLVLNVGTGRETSINELFEVVSSNTGATENAIYSEGRVGELRRSCLAVEKINEKLSWSPEIALSQGIRETVAAIRSRF